MDESTPKKIVWILGAGFGRSLGAPLLPDLLSGDAFLELDDHMKTVRDLFHRGVYGIPHLRGAKQRLWEHAEEFLERLDLAQRSPRFRQMVFGPDPIAALGTGPEVAQNLYRLRNESAAKIRNLNAAALRVVAGEVCTFLEDVDPHSERWDPYVHWVRSLGTNDTVLTFNYDRVPEILTKHVLDLKLNPPRDGFWIPLSGNEAAMESACLIKMHGSVNWKRRKDSSGSETLLEAGDSFARECTDIDEFAIATPGPRKRDMIQGPLAGLWELAGNAIANANAIVFVGYRIPPTDSFTRQWLTDRIRENAERQRALTHELPVHIVLGDDINHRDGRRLRGMMEELSNHVHVKQWAMFAEDFLGIVRDRDALIRYRRPNP